MTFTVIVACVVGFASCPLKSEHRQTISAPSERECVATARTAIAGFGYSASNFRIRCQR